MLWIGNNRREALKRSDEQRLKRSIAYMESHNTSVDEWPSKNEGDIWKLETRSNLTFSNEGNLVQYRPSNAVWDAMCNTDNIFFSADINKRILVIIAIGTVTGGCAELLIKRKDDGHLDLNEEKSLFTQLSDLLSVFTPLVALFLGFYVSFMVQRHVSQWGDMAGGNLWGGSVNYNMQLAAILPQEKFELVRKTACRWTLSIWEDTHDCCNLSLEEYNGGKGLRRLEARRLLSKDEVDFLLTPNLAGADNTYAQVMTAATSEGHPVPLTAEKTAKSMMKSLPPYP